MLPELETAVGATVDGFGGAGRIVGRGLDLTCVVTVAVVRLGAICVGDDLGQTVANAGDVLASFLETG